MLCCAVNRCLMLEFKKWLESDENIGLAPEFPIENSSDFTSWILEFLETGNQNPFPAPFEEFIGFTVLEDNSYRIDFFIVRVYANFDSNAAGKGPDGTGLIEQYKYWEDIMVKINEVAPPGQVGVHASAVWVRVMVEDSFITGVINAYATSLTCVFSALIIFTRNAKMAAISTVVILCIVILMMAILIENGLELGAIEAISLQIIVGLAVDFLLHLAHSYSTSTFYSPFGRTRHSFLQIGAPVISGATTTMISSFCLLFAETEILV